jgi:hypothetical protein
MLETGYGRYGGDSQPWNMAGIKKGGVVVGDTPQDFEVPATAYAGVRMHVNHMAAYTGKRPIGTRRMTATTMPVPPRRAAGTG